MKVINTENNSENEGELIFKGFWFDIARGFIDICGWILIILSIAYIFSGKVILDTKLIIFMVIIVFAIFIFSDILKIDVFIKRKVE